MSDLDRDIESTKSGSTDTQRDVVTRLGESRDVQAVEPLIAALHTGEWRDRAAAATGLGKLYYQSSKARALGSERIVSALLPYLKHEQPGFRINVARSLGWIKDPRAAEPLIELLHDEDDHVLQEVILALGQLGDTRVVDHFIDLLKDEDQWTRVSAASALANLGDIRAFEPLVKALDDEARPVRNRAATALEQLGDRRAIEPLRKLLEDEEADTRFWAIKSLVKFKDKGALPRLRWMAQHDTEWGNGQHLNVVAAEAIRAIEGWRPGSLVPLRLVDNVKMLWQMFSTSKDTQGGKRKRESK